MDSAHRATDKQIARLSQRIEKIYGRANQELKTKVNAYFARFEKADAQKKAMVNAGKLTESEYRQWRKGQLMTGKHYQELQRQTAAIMLNADREAARYINNGLAAAVKTNYNQVGKDVKRAGYSFELVNDNTVQNLVKNHKTLLPYKTVDGKKVERWNTRQVNAEILQGILQGESIAKIAKRLTEHITGMERQSAIRNARTAITGAENAGRMIGMQKARDDGIIMKKIWMAVNDERTRPAHAELDGVEVDIDEPFENDIGEIDYPGDPNADPENVYNCRCTLGTHVIGYRR